MIKRSDEHTHTRGCMVVITCANRKEHHMAYERMVELVQREKIDAANRVRKLHYATGYQMNGNLILSCYMCGVPYPCKTIKALDGEQ